MSRSVKKNVFDKDGSKYMRKLSHSRVRREVRRRITNGEWDIMPSLNELTNQWDICDWRCLIEKDEDCYESIRRK